MAKSSDCPRQKTSSQLARGPNLLSRPLQRKQRPICLVALTRNALRRSLQVTMEIIIREARPNAPPKSALPTKDTNSSPASRVVCRNSSRSQAPKASPRCSRARPLTHRLGPPLPALPPLSRESRRSSCFKSRKSR